LRLVVHALYEVPATPSGLARNRSDDPLVQVVVAVRQEYAVVARKEPADAIGIEHEQRLVSLGQGAKMASVRLGPVEQETGCVDAERAMEMEDKITGAEWHTSGRVMLLGMDRYSVAVFWSPPLQLEEENLEQGVVVKGEEMRIGEMLYEPAIGTRDAWLFE